MNEDRHSSSSKATHPRTQAMISKVAKATSRRLSTGAKKHANSTVMTSNTKMKKAPGAPRRFKSAFIFFSSYKHKQIKEHEMSSKTGQKTMMINVAKMVADAWRDLSPEDREVWEEKARLDKRRYEVEKSMYNGPWKVQEEETPKKDPSAPKKPVSAYLSFANSKRSSIKDMHPTASSAEVSRILAGIWRSAPQEVRQPYIDEEARLRKQYKIDKAAWQDKNRKAEHARIERESLALKAAMEQIHDESGDTAATQKDEPRSNMDEDSRSSEETRDMDYDMGCSPGQPACDPSVVRSDNFGVGGDEIPPSATVVTSPQDANFASGPYRRKPPGTVASSTWMRQLSSSLVRESSQNRGITTAHENQRSLDTISALDTPERHLSIPGHPDLDVASMGSEASNKSGEVECLMDVIDVLSSQSDESSTREMDCSEQSRFFDDALSTDTDVMGAGPLPVEDLMLDETHHGSGGGLF